VKLPTLYKKNKNGKTQVFNIETSLNSYTVTWGQQNGAVQVKTTVATGKNIGKKNETTPFEQAELEAKAVWNKKLKSGYSEYEDIPNVIELPMKVNNYVDHKKKIKFPCYISPKLNGVNGEYRLVNDEIVLLSRGGERYPIIKEQVEEVKKIFEALDTTSINGELYIHGEHLQDITSAVKKHNELTPKLRFYVFDFPKLEGTYAERCMLAYEKLNNLDLKYVTAVPVEVANSHEDIEFYFNVITNSRHNFEGAIIRNAECLYEYNTRSLNAFKYKKAKDAEFKIIGVNEDKNGHPVFIFESEGGEFKAKPKGSSEERRAMLEASKDYIGKYATVEYEMLSKGSNGLPGKPLKPVMIGLRECDNKGEPIE